MASKQGKSRQSADTTLALKQAALHQYFLTSREPHTLKDLEKNPPTLNPKIRGAEVKDLLNLLLADNQAKCEKIGSGNWYWSFSSDATKTRQKALEEMRNEHKKLETAVGRLEAQIDQRKAALGNDTASPATSGPNQKKVLEEERDTLKATNDKMLSIVAKQLSDRAVEEIHTKEMAIPELRAKAERWEENMATLESYVVKVSGGDRSVLQDVRRAVYGEAEDDGGEEPPAKRMKPDSE